MEAVVLLRTLPHRGIVVCRIWRSSAGFRCRQAFGAGVSPLLSGTLAFLIFTQIRRTILDRASPVEQMRRWGPAYVFAVVAVIGLVTLYKGLKNLRLDFPFWEALGLTILIGLVAARIAAFFIRRVRVDPEVERDFHFATVERMFGVLQIMSACAVAFAHGSNDVANAIGPVAAVLSVSATGVVEAASPVPLELLLVGGIRIVAGLAVMGYRVMATIGEWAQ